MVTIRPVILKVPSKIENLAGKERVKFLSRHARLALVYSAQKMGLELGELKKNKDGAPLPVNGNYWSLTHKSTFVGGVVAPRKIGIDIEEIRPISTSLIRRVAPENEWNLFNEDQDTRFVRIWTAKEAVLKATGRGIWYMASCRIVANIDKLHLHINCRDQDWVVEQHYFNGHIASIVKHDFCVAWDFEMASNGNGG